MEPAVGIEPVEPAGIIKILDIRHRGRQQFLGVTQLHGYSYARVEGEIRSLFPGLILNDDTIYLHVTPEPVLGSIITNDADLQNAISFPGLVTVIYVTAFLSNHAIRNRILGFDLRLRLIGNRLAALLSRLRGSRLFNLPRGASRRGAGSRRGRFGRGRN